MDLEKALSAAGEAAQLDEFQNSDAADLGAAKLSVEMSLRSHLFQIVVQLPEPKASQAVAKPIDSPVVAPAERTAAAAGARLFVGVAPFQGRQVNELQDRLLAIGSKERH